MEFLQHILGAAGADTLHAFTVVPGFGVYFRGVGSVAECGSGRIVVASGGAGIQADIKTMSALGVYAAAAVTAITVQNTRGVSRVVEVAPDVVAAQIEAVMTDLHPRVVKIGMTGSAALQQAVCQALEQAADDNPEVVADPVLRSSSGTDLMPPEAQLYYTRHMVPRAALLTPNLPEAAVLTNLFHTNREQVSS